MAMISVIVPVYNVEPYLHRCIDSILAQTFTDFELILINDGSSDQSGSICDSYSAKDQRVHVIHQENQGLSAARNAGIDHAMHTDSEWITFIDSDDYVALKYLEALYGAAQGYDIAAANRQMTEGEDLPETAPAPAVLLSPHDYFLYYEGHTLATDKLYRKSLFSNIRFPVGKIHEDMFITHKILFRFEVIPYIGTCLYAHFKNPNSLTFSSWNLKRLDALPAIEEQISFFIDKGFLDIAEHRFKKYISLNQRSQNNIRNLDSLEPREKQRLIGRLNRKLSMVLSRYRRYHWLSIKSKKNIMLLLNVMTRGSLGRVWKRLRCRKE